MEHEKNKASAVDEFLGRHSWVATAFKAGMFFASWKWITRSAEKFNDMVSNPTVGDGDTWRGEYEPPPELDWNKH